LWLSLPASVKADETDGFTCRARPLRESEGVLDQLVNTAIQAAVDRANRRPICDADCLFDELRKQVGATYRHRLTGIPHARIAKQASAHPDVDRCHLKFRESIYGARPYNQPWLYPFNGRIIFLADSIRLSGHLVGVDKINHFIREGLAHWRALDRDDGGFDEYWDLWETEWRRHVARTRPDRRADVRLRMPSADGVRSAA
jgi:hypothetical protein